MNPPLEAEYLVETSYDETGRLLVFDEFALTDYLTENIQRHHYAGEADEVHGIYRYVSPGHLSELVLIRDGDAETTDDDYIDRRYRLHEKADAQGFGAIDDNKVLEFTVRIDGRV